MALPMLLSASPPLTSNSSLAPCTLTLLSPPAVSSLAKPRHVIAAPTLRLASASLLTPLSLKRTVRASASDGDAVTDAGGLDLPSEGGVEGLPLESKVREREEQRLRMRLAKKARLRRNRLVRKRHLRKKGRWPPSKMRKNKNV